MYFFAYQTKKITCAKDTKIKSNPAANNWNELITWYVLSKTSDKPTRIIVKQIPQITFDY